MHKRAPIVLALGGICLTSAAQAQQPDAPDLDFLEYLGSWQGEDDEWLVIAEWEKDNPPKHADDDAEGASPAPGNAQPVPEKASPAPESASPVPENEDDKDQ